MKIEQYKLNENDVRIPIPENYRDCVTLIKSDYYRINAQKKAFCAIAIKTLLPFKTSVLFWRRLCSYRGWLFPLFYLMYKIACTKSMVEIPLSVRIGYGLYIGHGICMVVNGGTVIGNNVNLAQFLNIGTNHKTPAMIGDNVYIGPHVCLVEDVKIGNNSTIGAGAVVTKDVPQNATVAGVPAKVLNYDNPGRYIGNPYVSGEIKNEILRNRHWRPIGP